ncbi:MAG TPA: hypothetical protein VGL77_17255 [Armatimonadota bacterium]
MAQVARCSALFSIDADRDEKEKHHDVGQRAAQLYRYRPQGMAQFGPVPDIDGIPEDEGTDQGGEEHPYEPEQQDHYRRPPRPAHSEKQGEARRQQREAVELGDTMLQQQFRDRSRRQNAEPAAGL